PHTVAWTRALVAGVVLLALIRPWRYSWTKKTLLESAVFGSVLLAMNVTFYIAINYLPLGAAVALEFVGPVIVAARGAAGIRGKVSVALAAAGVALISFVGLDWSGVGPREIGIGRASCRERVQVSVYRGLLTKNATRRRAAMPTTYSKGETTTHTS